MSCFRHLRHRHGIALSSLHQRWNPTPTLIPTPTTPTPIPTHAYYQLDCSAGACERNWSAYSLIHTKIRNRLSTAQLERLVFCRANLRLFRNFSSLAGPKQRYASGNTIKALEYIAKGYSAIKEVDRVISYTNPDDERLQPLLKKAKENFQMALEVDNRNTDAMVWLGRLHLKYCIVNACTAVGADLLREAADLGNADAQYELACHMRRKDGVIGGLEQSYKYLESAACQLHPKALFLVGVMYLGGDCTKRNVEAAKWCFRKAADQGHSAARTVYGALLLKGLEENDDNFIAKLQNAKQKLVSNTLEGDQASDLELAKQEFQMAADAGEELAYEWLKRLPEEQSNESKAVLSST